MQTCPAKTVVFLHIPKTGGTSLHQILVPHFAREEICPERFNRLESWKADELARFRFFSGHFDKRGVGSIPQQKKVVTLLREPRKRILSLYYFWRSHKEKVIERANLHGPRMAKSMRLLEFLRHRADGIPLNTDNVLARTLLGRLAVGPNGAYIVPKSEVLERVVEYLEKMEAFGVVDAFEESVRHIVARLGFPVPDTVPHARDSSKLTDPTLEPIEREPVTSEIAAELDRLTELDQQVYEYAVTRFRRIRQDEADCGRAERVRTIGHSRAPKRMNLTEFAARFGLDKGTKPIAAAAHRYTYLYDLLFGGYRHQPITFLELGCTWTGSAVGGRPQRSTLPPSTQMWLAYFTEAQVFRFDVEDFSQHSTPRLTTVQGDPGSEADLRRLAEAAPAFDVIVDDASHASYHQQLALMVLFPKLAPGGVYIIEDLHAQPPALEEALPAVPKAALFLNSYFERGTYIRNPLLTAEHMAAIESSIASYASFPAFDGSASRTKLIVLQKSEADAEPLPRDALAAPMRRGLLETQG